MNAGIVGLGFIGEVHARAIAISSVRYQPPLSRLRRPVRAKLVLSTQ
jgi:hypothetical protein